MDIPNLSTQPTNKLPKSSSFSIPIIIMVVILAVGAGFGFSRLFPQGNKNLSLSQSTTDQPQLSTDSITNTDQLKTNQLYGDVNSTFKDSTTGTIQKGGINNVGTHTLVRDGGPTQSVALTSSTVDLDLFVGKKVEIKGQTNAAAKVGWLMDVGSIKILQ